AGSIAITLSTTADASAGTPTRPAIGICRVAPAGCAPSPWNRPSAVDWPGRVSSARRGASSGWNVAAGSVPDTSTITSAAAYVNTHTLPLLRRVITRLGTVAPGP